MKKQKSQLQDSEADSLHNEHIPKQVVSDSHSYESDNNEVNEQIDKCEDAEENNKASDQKEGKVDDSPLESEDNAK